MTGWKDYRSPDDVMRGPMDGWTWKELDDKYEFLRMNPRHVRLGIAMDGSNPFSHNSTMAYCVSQLQLTAMDEHSEGASYSEHNCARYVPVFLTSRSGCD